MSLLVTALMVFVTFSQEPAAAQPGDPKPRAAAIIAALAAKDFTKVEDQFDDKMKAALPTERLAMAWGTILAQAGAFKSCGTAVRVRGAGRAVRGVLGTIVWLPLQAECGAPGAGCRVRSKMRSRCRWS